MSKQLILTRCYGVTFDQAHFQALRTDVDSLLDRVTDTQGTAEQKEHARTALGAQFVRYGEAYPEAWILTVTASITEVRDLGIMPLPPRAASLGFSGMANPFWDGVLRIVINVLQLRTLSDPRWYVLAAYH